MKAKSRLSKKHYILFIVVIFSIFSVLITAILSSNTNALEYSSSAGINFTINPSISVSVSGDLIIDELAPGSSSDSNIITVNVATNTSAGYVLTTTVGELGGTRDLVNTSSNSNTFTSLSSNISTLSGFSDNTWGYSYSTDSGTTWISGNVDSSPITTGYNGLPLDNNTDSSLKGSGGIKLIDTTTANTGSIQFKIGAKASNTQAAGEYTNTINFYAVTYEEPLSLADSFAAEGKTMLNGYYKMQDMSPTICSNVTAVESQLQVIDVRDNNVYTIAKLKDGNCWMTQNLAFTGSELNSITSNVPPEYTESNPLTITWYDSKTNGGTKCNTASNYAYINACLHQPDNTDLSEVNSFNYTKKDLGAWYNYAGATAMTIVGYENSNTDIYSICPYNWSLPTHAQYDGLISIPSSKITFKPIYGGYYVNGEHRNSTTGGYWWSTDSIDDIRYHRYNMAYRNDALGRDRTTRPHSLFVRCIANS